MVFLKKERVYKKQKGTTRDVCVVDENVVQSFSFVLVETKNHAVLALNWASCALVNRRKWPHVRPVTMKSRHFIRFDFAVLCARALSRGGGSAGLD